MRLYICYLTIIGVIIVELNALKVQTYFDP